MNNFNRKLYNQNLVRIRAIRKIHNQPFFNYTEYVKIHLSKALKAKQHLEKYGI